MCHSRGKNSLCIRQTQRSFPEQLIEAGSAGRRLARSAVFFRAMRKRWKNRGGRATLCMAVARRSVFEGIFVDVSVNDPRVRGDGDRAGRRLARSGSVSAPRAKRISFLHSRRWKNRDGFAKLCIFRALSWMPP